VSNSSVTIAALGAAAVAQCAVAQIFTQQTTTLFPAQLEYTNQISAADIDGDGDFDLVFANGQGFSSQGIALRPRIYVNRINEEAGNFADETLVRAPNVLGWFRGVEFGDIDGDGDWDMILAQDFNKIPVLLVNDGDGFFTNESATRLPQIAMSSSRAQFADVDNDGDLDLFFVNSGPTNRFGTGQPRLYLNDGTGHFTDVTATHIPQGNLSNQMDCIFSDVNGNFALDVHIGGRFGLSRLWLNNGDGTFTNFAIPAGGNAYSYDFADVNGNGKVDLFGAQGAADILLLNNMPTGFVNASSQISPNLSIDDNDSKFFDYDNDGDYDLFIGSLGSQERVYRNDGNGFFSQVSGVMPIVSDATLDILIVDVTGNGIPDVITGQGEAGNFQNRIYINSGVFGDTIPPKVNATEQVPDGKLDRGIAGPFAVRTVVFDSHTSDRGYFDAGIYLHYAVNGGDEQTLEMKWVGNSMWRVEIPAVTESSTIEYYVSAWDRAGNEGFGETLTFTISGGTTLGDLNGDGVVDGADLGILLNLWGSADPTADLNGDGVVDGADLGILLNAWTTDRR